MKGQLQNRRPTLIEEEPVHEFYANLFTETKTIKSDVSLSLTPHDNLKSRIQFSPVQHPLVSSTTRRNNHDSSGVSNDTIVRESEFSRVYRMTLSSPPKLSSLSLNVSNKGYQILSSMGWKESEGGLGRKRQGSLAPIKTQLRKGKHGLGSGKNSVARVTHFQSPKTIDTSAAHETRKNRRKRVKEEAEIERRREKRARIMINSNLPTLYDELQLALL